MLAVASQSGPHPAPFFHDVAEGPAGASAYWVEAADGTRLRFGVWPVGDKGTVWLFPGRTEYIEKYGRVAQDLADAGYGMVSFDWRGQGLSDRPRHRRDVGHVTSFDEYREDVAAFRAALEGFDLPGPHYMIAHSMGGAIGLRALHDGLEVNAAVFSGPMWGIQMASILRSLSGIVFGLSRVVGMDKTFAPTQGPYEPMEFDNNPLTTDRAQFDYMSRQLEAHPELTLGGPSSRWVQAALTETSALMGMAAPDLPTLAIVGTREKIVEIDAVSRYMERWPESTYLKIEGGEHEVLMESPARREKTLTAILAHFAAHS